jgi:hypothetical protein
MKNKIQNARFDEDETDHLIANFGVKVSPEKWHDLQTFLRGNEEPFLEQERQRANVRQRPNRGL